MMLKHFVLKLIDLREISYRSIKKVLSRGLMRVMESRIAQQRLSSGWIRPKHRLAKVSKDLRSYFG